MNMPRRLIQDAATVLYATPEGLANPFTTHCPCEAVFGAAGAMRGEALAGRPVVRSIEADLAAMPAKVTNGSPRPKPETVSAAG